MTKARGALWLCLMCLVAGCLLGPWHTGSLVQGFQRPQGPVARNGDRSISGTVFDDDRQPVGGVSVRAMRPTYDFNGATNLVPAGRPFLSDTAGRFFLTGLAPDIYVVSVEPGPGGTTSRRPTRFFSSVYYPGGYDWRSATPLNIATASAAGIDIYLPLKDMVRVNGSIYNAADSEARVSAFYVSSVDDPSTSLQRLPNLARDTRTSFQLEGLPPGTYDLFPVLSRTSERDRVGHVRMTVSRNLQGMTIEILPGINLLGKVHIRAFETTLPVDLSKLKVGLLARKGNLVSPPAVDVAADGRFTLSNVAEMQYQLSISGLPATAYVETADIDGTDVLHSWVTIGRLSQRLQIVIDTAGAEIHGTLVDLHRERFASPALLVLVPVQRKGNLPASGLVVVPTDNYGVFTVRAVPPGDYRLLAWSKPNGTPYFNEEFMKGYLGMGYVVHVYRGSRIQAEAVVVDTR
jgi:hypothetical protein